MSKLPGGIHIISIPLRLRNDLPADVVLAGGLPAEFVREEFAAACRLFNRFVASVTYVPFGYSLRYVRKSPESVLLRMDSQNVRSVAAAFADCDVLEFPVGFFFFGAGFLATGCFGGCLFRVGLFELELLSPEPLCADALWTDER